MASGNGGSNSASAVSGGNSPRFSFDDSNDGDSFDERDNVGNRGKPLIVSFGKRGRRGTFTYGAGRPKGGGQSPIHGSIGWKGNGSGGPNKPGVLMSMKKRAALASEARRRGRQPKIRGMVGLQVD